MQHIVKRGDTLWRIAIRNQGSGTQWPKLVAHHNNEVARRGPYSGLLRIEDPNLIFIGQTLFLPPKAKRITRGSGNKHEANCMAKNCDLAIDYGIGFDTPPCEWSKNFGEIIIKAALSGDITIEMLSDSRHRQNLEILLSRDSVEVKQKLKKLYDPVINKLIAEPSVKFKNGELKLNSPIAAQANLGPYTIELQTGATPMQMKGFLKPPKINANIKNDGYDCKFSADIKYEVEVAKLPKNQPVREPVAEPVEGKELQRENIVRETQAVHTTKWEQMVNEKGYATAIVFVLSTIAASIIYRLSTRGGLILKPSPSGSIVTPFRYTIDRNPPMT